MLSIIIKITKEFYKNSFQKEHSALPSVLYWLLYSTHGHSDLAATHDTRIIVKIYQLAISQPTIGQLSLPSLRGR